MTRDEYVKALSAALAEQRGVVKERLSRVFASVDEKTVGVDLTVFMGQDGDGEFSVVASADGPDLHVRQKAIADVSTLVDVVHTREGFSPPVPMVDPDDCDFDLHETAVGVVMSWVDHLWRELALKPSVRVRLVSADGLGSRPVVELHKPRG